MKYLIATYGSLRKGYNNHYLLSKSKYIGEYHTGPGYTRIFKGLPYLLEDSSGTGCMTEVYEVDDRTLDLLDLLEGHDMFYVRTPITVYKDNKSLDVEIYIMPEERL